MSSAMQRKNQINADGKQASGERENQPTSKGLSKPKKGSRGAISGSPDSRGGSREGNIGHQNDSEGGHGQREVNE
jgi:hypothetical protein